MNFAPPPESIYLVVRDIALAQFLSLMGMVCARRAHTHLIGNSSMLLSHHRMQRWSSPFRFVRIYHWLCLTVDSVTALCSSFCPLNVLTLATAVYFGWQILLDVTLRWPVCFGMVCFGLHFVLHALLSCIYMYDMHLPEIWYVTSRDRQACALCLERILSIASSNWFRDWRPTGLYLHIETNDLSARAQATLPRLLPYLNRLVVLGTEYVAGDEDAANAIPFIPILSTRSKWWVPRDGHPLSSQPAGSVTYGRGGETPLTMNPWPVTSA